MSYFHSTNPAIVGETEESMKHTSDREASNSTEIWTGYLPNTDQDCHCYTSIFGETFREL